jgi:hypothetical protein
VEGCNCEWSRWHYDYCQHSVLFLSCGSVLVTCTLRFDYSDRTSKQPIYFSSHIAQDHVDILPHPDCPLLSTCFFSPHHPRLGCRCLIFFRNPPVSCHPPTANVSNANSNFLLFTWLHARVVANVSRPVTAEPLSAPLSFS